MNKFKIIVLFFIVGLSEFAFSQSIVHEVGGIIGGGIFHSDYGQRADMETNLKNSGFAVSFVDYLNFSYKDYGNHYFHQHFKVRNEISYNKTELQHYGEWVEKNSITSQQLKAMRGSTQILSIGSQLEYNLMSIREFEYTLFSFNPYIGIGPQLSYYTATATSEMGELGTTATTPVKYLMPSDGRPHGYSNESKAVFALSLNVGTRFKLTRMSDLILDVKSQFFFSDWVDGLNPNKDLYNENKSNDWQTVIGIGYIQYLDF